MMKPELRGKILVFNRRRAEEGAKASDMDVLIAAIMKLPPGQLKKVLSDEVMDVLRRYGWDDNG